MAERTKEREREGNAFEKFARKWELFNVINVYIHTTQPLTKAKMNCFWREWYREREKKTKTPNKYTIKWAENDDCNWNRFWNAAQTVNREIKNKHIHTHTSNVMRQRGKNDRREQMNVWLITNVQHYNVNDSISSKLARIDTYRSLKSNRGKWECGWNVRENFITCITGLASERLVFFHCVTVMEARLYEIQWNLKFNENRLR